MPCILGERERLELRIHLAMAGHCTESQRHSKIIVSLECSHW